MCKKQFTDAKIKIEHKDSLVIVSIQSAEDKKYEECFKLQADLSYEKFFFLSALSGKAINNFHFLKSIRSANLDE